MFGFTPKHGQAQQVAAIPVEDTQEFNELLAQDRLRTAQHMALGFRTPGPALMLGERLLNKGNLAAAEQWFIRAEHWGGGHAAINGQAQVALAAGDHEKAEGHLARLPGAEAISPGVTRQLTQASFQSAMAAGDLAGAGAIVEQSQSAEQAMTLGWAYLERGDTGYAARWFEHSLALGGGDDARIGAATTALAGGQADLARGLLDAVTTNTDRLNGLRVRIDLTAAQTALAAGQYDNASSYLDAARSRAQILGDEALIEATENQGFVMSLRRAQAAYDANDFETALELASEVGQLARPQIADAALLIAGWSNYRLGDYSSASEAFKRLENSSLAKLAAEGMAKVEAVPAPDPIQITNRQPEPQPVAEPEPIVEPQLIAKLVAPEPPPQPPVQDQPVPTPQMVATPAPLEPVTVSTLSTQPRAEPRDLQVGGAANNVDTTTTPEPVLAAATSLGAASLDEARDGWFGRAIDWIADAPQSALALAEDVNPVRLLDLFDDEEPITAEQVQRSLADSLAGSALQPGGLVAPPLNTGFSLSLGEEVPVLGEVIDRLFIFDPPSFEPDLEPILPVHEGFGFYGASGSERVGLSGQLEGSYQLNSDWDLVGFAGGTETSEFDEYVAGFSLRYSFGQERRTVNRDAPPVRVTFAPR